MRVVVIGGGFAGLAAAIALQERRCAVTLVERRGVLGGRATSFHDAVTGSEVDNGTHVLVGAYHETLDLLAHAGAGDLLCRQDNLRLDYIDDRGPSSLVCPAVRAPLHLGLGLLGLRLPWRSRWDALRLTLAIRFGPPPTGETLGDYLGRHRQSATTRRLLWDPLATAILNEPPDRADARLFYNVFHMAFLSSNEASAVVFPRAGWGVMAERLARYFEDRAGVVLRRALVEAIEVDGQQVRGVRLAQRPTGRDAIQAGGRTQRELLEADAVVAAVPWHAVRPLLPEALRARDPFARLDELRAAPIVSVELWLDRAVIEHEMVGLRDCELEWVFDKGRLHGRAGAPQHLSFVVSAAHRSAPRPNAELVGMAVAALKRYFPAMANACVERSLVLREPSATFSCDPATAHLRPGPETPLGGLYLAGDWTATGLPATIEGAVLSGRRAARLIAGNPLPPLRG